MRSSARAIRCLLLGLVLLAPSCQQKIQPTARPFLWRIATEPPSWLYGTIHLPDPRVTTLPPAVQDALSACAVVVTEIDLGGQGTAEAMAASALPKGQILPEVLPQDTYARLAQYLKAKRYPIEGLLPMKPWVVMTMLPLLDDPQTMLTGTALDAVLVREAARLGKATAALETVAEQLGVFDSFTLAEQAQMLDGTLRMLARASAEGRKPIEELVQSYLAGDLDALQRLLDELSGFEGLADLEARLEQAILLDRNHEMAERIARRLRAEPRRSHFIAVGAAHYPGEQGLLALLRAAGFAIERVEAAPARQGKEAAPAVR